ncbi:hypothetical protein B0H13DRAFT_133173 [Mycena leptocephala]|nr:hypothetical protein B0H13DRAFT_133173 [Mycena leptocephala]
MPAALRLDFFQSLRFRQASTALNPPPLRLYPHGLFSSLPLLWFSTSPPLPLRFHIHLNLPNLSTRRWNVYARATDVPASMTPLLRRARFLIARRRSSRCCGVAYDMRRNYQQCGCSSRPSTAPEHRARPWTRRMCCTRLQRRDPDAVRMLDKRRRTP